MTKENQENKKCPKCGGIVEIVDEERYHVCHQQNQENKKCCEHDIELSYACPLCKRDGREYGKSLHQQNQEKCEHKKALEKSGIPYSEDYICRACHPSENQESYEWRKKFDELWADAADPTPNRKARIKSFITQLLARERKELVEKVEELIDELEEPVLRMLSMDEPELAEKKKTSEWHVRRNTLRDVIKLLTTPTK